jgi:hypothetical protein
LGDGRRRQLGGRFRRLGDTPTQSWTICFMTPLLFLFGIQWAKLRIDFCL